MRTLAISFCLAFLATFAYANGPKITPAPGLGEGDVSIANETSTTRRETAKPGETHENGDFQVENGPQGLPDDVVDSVVATFLADAPNMTVDGQWVSIANRSDAELRIVGSDAQARSLRRTDLHQRIVFLSLSEGTWETQGQVDVTFTGDGSNLTCSRKASLPATVTGCEPFMLCDTVNLELVQGTIPWDVLWTNPSASSLQQGLLELAVESPELFIERTDRVIEVGFGAEVFEYVNSDHDLQGATLDALSQAHVSCDGFGHCVHECFSEISTPLSYLDLLCLGVGAAACAFDPPTFPVCAKLIFKACGITAVLGEIAAFVACSIKCL